MRYASPRLKAAVFLELLVLHRRPSWHNVERKTRVLLSRLDILHRDCVIDTATCLSSSTRLEMNVTVLWRWLGGLQVLSFGWRRDIGWYLVPPRPGSLFLHSDPWDTYLVGVLVS